MPIVRALECGAMTSLVTRCPACTTLFKVVPDQLRISEGWVRCGQCDEVFDANAHMQAPMQLASEPHPSVSNADDAPPALLQDAASHEPLAHVGPQVLESQGAAQHESVAEVSPEVVAAEALYPTGPVQEAPVGLQAQTSASESIARAEADELVQSISAKSNSPSFLQASNASPRLGPRHRRWPLALSGVVLAVLLAAQWIVHDRDRLAATQPQWRPLLDHGCALLGCSIRPLRRIESVVIESSSFVKVKSDVYRLSFTVRNTAPWPLAIPAAELTLTDAQDQSVFRRVLSPAELSVSAETLAAAEELAVNAPIALKVPASVGEKVSGYRLLVFYP